MPELKVHPRRTFWRVLTEASTGTVHFLRCLSNPLEQAIIFIASS